MKKKTQQYKQHSKLKERAKELNCLYKIEELLNNTDISLEQLFQDVIDIIPCGWQYPEICQVKIIYKNKKFKPPDYKKTPFVQNTDIVVHNKTIGKIYVSYREEVPLIKGKYFLKEETKLLNTVADRIGQMISHKKLQQDLNKWEQIKENFLIKNTGKWQPIIDILQKSDKKLYIYISRKMLNYLCWRGIDEAKALLEQFGSVKKVRKKEILEGVNFPSKKQTWGHISNISTEIFHVASRNLKDDQIVDCIQKWMQEDKSRFLVRAIENQSSLLSELIDAIMRFRYVESKDISLSPFIMKGLSVSLVRRFLSDDLRFMNVAKNYIDVHDYFDLVQRIIFPAGSQGKLGGKSAGIILAKQIIDKSRESEELLKDIKVPKTWYITSDGLTSFIHFNNLDEVIEQKYKDKEEIRIEYPNLIQIFKNSYFPPEIIKGLSTAVDDFGNKPIIVRSSSLLEDRVGAVFSGKYKSLFLANQGSKEDRLEALMDAIAEVYASTFAPDPIEYRSERGLLDFYEEMGIMIQEVVGNRIGDYFIPNFAGVAFSNNEFLWSPRISRHDGLIRAVPGLGTRAVDRIADDYPILIAPGKPELRVNVTPDEVCLYSPKKMDVINLTKNCFETIEISELLMQYGDQFPDIHNIVSLYKDGCIQCPSALYNLDFERNNLVVTFDGLIRRTPLIKQIKTLLNLLREKIGNPIDIEFAHDGKNLYLLQCRPQSYLLEAEPCSIPKNIPEEHIIFSADRYVSNASIPNIQYIVYVNVEGYRQLSSLNELRKIGSIIGKINKMLPKRRFILMGPGRWGSRGDIKLGVNVTYADINNSAMLIEIARKKGHYVPELSFGTHFFQDLVESSIRYLPLYPDEEGTIFNEEFLLQSRNIISELLPEYSSFADTVHIIDVPKSNNGSLLRILMNADINRAVGFLYEPDR